jgi:hypothetical protein
MSITLDVKITNQLTPKIKSIQQKLNNLPKEAYQEFVKLTPIRTGNAKRSTKLQGKTIEANYAYAGVLDKGRHMTSKGMRGSEQAPKGMTKPTVDFIKNRVGQIVRGK